MKIVNQIFFFLFLTIRKLFLFFSKLFPVSQRQKLNLSQIFTTKNPTHLLILGIILFTFIITSLAVLFWDSESYISSSSMHVTPPVYAQDQHEEDDETVIKHGSEDDFIPRLVPVKSTDGKHEDEDEEIDDYSLYDPHHAYEGDDEANNNNDEEEDDYDDDLNWRTEEFIGMMKKGWREEMLKERLHHTLSDSASTQDSQITTADYNFGSTTQTHNSTPTTYHYAHEQVADKLQIISLYG